MAIKWRTLVFNLMIWLLAELLLGFLGLDNLADYSEFLQNRHTAFLLG